MSADAENTQDGKTAQTEAPASFYAGASPVMLGTDIEIHPAKSLQAMASPLTEAFEAVDRINGQQHLALLCNSASVPRLTLIGTYKNIKNPHLLRLADAGVVNWTPEGRERLALVFDKPPGRRLMALGAAAPVRISDDKVLNTLIVPILSVLNDLANANAVHGAITPNNIFLQGTAGAETAVVGECLSSAPGMRTPAAFETIERGMAQPSGRGHGSIKNDLYGLGVCVALAIKGQNPFAGKSVEQVISDKIEHGTYSCLLGGERMSSAMIEFLRGVLADNENARWNLDDALQWVEGQRMSGKQSHIPMMAARPYVFLDKKYWELRTLAMDFSHHVQDAAAALEKDQFEHWIKRNFDDGNTIARLEKVWAKEDPALREKLVASVCMAIDPLGPVRYKDMSVFPGGYGTALAEAMATGRDLQPYGEVLSQQLLTVWINQRFDDLSDATVLLTSVEKSRNFLAQKMLGYGLERVVYLLNTDVVCLSPALQKFFAMSPGHILRALEVKAQAGEPVEGVLDRHMIAFISVREQKMIDPYLGHIISLDKGFQMVGMLRTLAAIQRRFQIASVPSLGKWLIANMAPIIEKYNDRDLRRQIAQRLAHVGDVGNLTAILEVVDSPVQVQDDAGRFTAAKREYAALFAEKADLVRRLGYRQVFGLATGRQVAMLVSTMASIVAIMAIVLLHLLWR
jgi:hypothetical protein